MTGTTQDHLTPEAHERLEQYLRQVRAALIGCQSVSADDVERDIREHIENELALAEGVVSRSQLDAVLERLGSPTQWLPQTEVPWWRRFLDRCRRGPEDWRLAYLALALLVLGMVFPVFILVSYLASRAALEAARGHNEGLGAQRWFIYPALLIVDAALVALFLLGPSVLAVGASLPLHDYVFTGLRPHSPEFWWHLTGFAFILTTGATAVWWMTLGSALASWPGLMRAVFHPFADRFGSRHGRILVYTGMVLGIAWGIAVALVYLV